MFFCPPHKALHGPDTTSSAMKTLVILLLFASAPILILVAPMVKNLPAAAEVQSLGREDPLEKGMANLSSILGLPLPRVPLPSWRPERGHVNRQSPGERQAPSLAGRRRLRSVGNVAGGLRGGSPAFIRGFPQGTEALEPPTALRGSRGKRRRLSS